MAETSVTGGNTATNERTMMLTLLLQSLCLIALVSLFIAYTTPGCPRVKYGYKCRRGSTIGCECETKKIKTNR